MRLVHIIYIYRYNWKNVGKKCHTHCSLPTCGKLNVLSKILISNIFGVLWFVKMCSLTLRLRWMVAHGRQAGSTSLSLSLFQSQLLWLVVEDAWKANLSQCSCVLIAYHVIINQWQDTEINYKLEDLMERKVKAPGYP